MTITEKEDYFVSLRKRRFSGLLYRKWWLYPRLASYLKGRVLDIGCGIGDFLQFRPNTVGVDVNVNSILWCQSHNLDARIMEPDILPFDDSGFDAAILDNVLEHIIDPEPLMLEICRVLRTNATIIIGVPGQCGFSAREEHITYYAEQDVVKLLSKAGFSCRTIFHMPIRSAFLEKRLTQYCVYGVFDR